MRGLMYEGQVSKPGDRYLTEYGELREVVTITNANDLLIEMRKRQPRFNGASAAGLCSLYGETSRREKRDYERYKAKVAKGRDACWSR